MLLNFVIRNQLTSGDLYVYSSLILILRYTMKANCQQLRIMDTSILDSFHAVHVSACR